MAAAAATVASWAAAATVNWSRRRRPQAARRPICSMRRPGCRTIGAANSLRRSLTARHVERCRRLDVRATACVVEACHVWAEASVTAAAVRRHCSEVRPVGRRDRNVKYVTLRKFTEVHRTGNESR